MPDDIQLDSNGWPVLFANVANSGVAVIDPNASSGNNAHDASSGKFTRKGKPSAEQLRQQTEPAADPLQFKRMLDAVRDAAREFDSPNEGDIREFLAGRAANPAQVDVKGFLAQVIEQRLNDLSDLFDQQLRASGSLKRGRRTVKVTAPRGFAKRALGALDDSQVQELTQRLIARGHSEDEVGKFFATRRPSG